MNMILVDAEFELAYSQFKASKAKHPELNITQLLDDYVAPVHREAVFKRWSDEEFIVERPEAPVIKGEVAVWRPGYTSVGGPHWTALQTFLIEHGGRTEAQVHSLDKASDKVLFGIGDPSIQIGATQSTKGVLQGPQKFSGLVIGYVQSGKTANYTALAAKAYDAGYQLVIVLTGIHNALRRQTQIRMNNELGVLAGTPERPTAHSNNSDPKESIMELTSEDLLHGDFQYVHLDSKKTLMRGKHLCVTKKNASVLRRLIQWLGSEVKVPTLIIDDEADQASINTASFTSEEDLDEDIKPTTINGLIRDLKNNCTGHCAYVAYTATPYANVFIDMDANDEKYLQDLYPENFIISLPKPDGYMGPAEFFGPQITGEDSGEDFSANVLRIMNSEEIKDLQSLHSKHQSGTPLLTPQLMKSIHQFLLATCARRETAGQALPSSFLVHTSPTVKDQENLGDRISKYVDQMIQSWRYNKEPFRDILEKEWAELCEELKEDQFKIDFERLTSHLDSLIGRFEGLQVKVLNFRSEDDLDYEITPDLVSIIVGGNKLSRGLTLEGLIFSYFVRKTAREPQADTLTQMGRFFGYRREIVDITRVFTTDKLRNDFREISQMEEALRQDIVLYEKTGKTPRDFAPRVQRRAGIMPTAANRMRAAAVKGVSYSGDLIQTTSFDFTNDAVAVNKSNLEQTSKLLTEIENLGLRAAEVKSQRETTKRIWTEVPGANVLNFIQAFRTADSANRFVSSHISTYIRDLLYHPNDAELTHWSVAVIGRSPLASLGSENFGLDFAFGRINRSLDLGSEKSIGTLINPLTLSASDAAGDEIIDFTPDEIAEAREIIANGKQKASTAARSVRPKNRGLLLIYPISPSSVGVTEGTNNDMTLGEGVFGDKTVDDTVVGLSIVFPESLLELNEYYQQGRIMDGR